MEYTREELISICEASVVPLADWRNRDTPEAQIQVGKCWALLKAGCEFNILRSEKHLCTGDDTIWIDIIFPTFNTFEYGKGHHETENFYLPTRKRLEERKGKDWY